MPEYVLNLTAQGVEMVLAALGELKLKDSIDIYFDIRSQIMQQNEEKQAPVAPSAREDESIVQAPAKYEQGDAMSVPRVKAEPVKPK